MALEVDIYGRNLDVTDRVNEYVSTKVGKLDRYIGNIDEARVDLAHVKSARNANDRHVAQITIRGKGFILRSEERADDIFAAVDTAYDKMQRRIRRYKGKKRRNREDAMPLGEALMEIAEAEEEEEPPAVIARRKRFVLAPMDELEAIEQMKMLGHENFFVFFNANTSEINVLYRRRDGAYGLIEPQVE